MSKQIIFTANMPLTAENMNKLAQTDWAKEQLATKVDNSQLANLTSAIINLAYPVGTIYCTVDDSFNPIAKFGGNWDKITDRMLIAKGSAFNVTGQAGGSKDSIVVSHTHSSLAHNHSISGNTGSEGNHSHAVKGFKNFFGVGSGTYYEAPSIASSATCYAPNTSGAGVMAVAHGSDGEGYTNPSHSHSINISSGSSTVQVGNMGEDGTNKNMPPYIVCNMWKRIS